VAVLSKEEALPIYEALKKRLEEVEMEKGILEHELGDILKTIRGLESLVPGLLQDGPAQPPKTKDAIKIVLQESDSGMSVATIHKELVRRGWLSDDFRAPIAAVRASTRRLKEEFPDNLVSLKDGRNVLWAWLPRPEGDGPESKTVISWEEAPS